MFNVYTFLDFDYHKAVMNNYWLKQTSDKPLFPDLLWSRPENRQQAGKLLIIGGNVHGFAVPAEAYQVAVKTGVGTAKVLLPDALQKIVGRIFENGEYAPSTLSGSFSKKALASWLDYSQWADAVLIAGALGRNSETAILLESFVRKYSGLLTITRDAVDYFSSQPQAISHRQDTLVVCSIAQLQKLTTSLHFPKAVTFSMDLIHLVDLLHELTSQYAFHIIVKHLETLCVGVDGIVSTTKLKVDKPVWRVETASYATVWWLQNFAKSFEALTTSILASSVDFDVR